MPRDPEYLPPQTPEPLHSELLDKILRNNPALILLVIPRHQSYAAAGRSAASFDWRVRARGLS